MAFPNIPFSNITVSSNTPTIVTKSLSGREQRTQVASQYFDVTVSFSNLSEAHRKELQGFIASVKGSFSTFTLTFPTDSNVGNSSGNYNGATISVSSASAGATTIAATTTNQGSLKTVLKAGDLIKFSSHDKVYTVTADATTSAGSFNISIYPALRQTITTNTVTHKTVPMLVRIAEDVTGLSMDQTLFSNFDLKFVEVL